MLKGKTVLLGVTGGIAAYKAAALASALVKQHAAVEDPNCEWMFLVFVLALFAVSLKLVRVGSRSDRYIDGGEGPLFFG